MISHPKYKFGRKARIFDPRVKQLKTVLPQLPVAPPTADWTKGLTQFGMMLNDKLGCCTISAIYHAKQIWTVNNGGEVTQPDSCVLKLYKEACGYVPGQPDTDQGGIEQNVLAYLLKHGMPLADGKVDKLEGFVEVDYRIQNEVKLTVHEFGLSYIGFIVPSSIFDAHGEPLPVWDVIPGGSEVGGHAVILVAYDADFVTVISWGRLFKMTWAFFENYCKEAYALIDKSWLNATGKTPLGLTLHQIESLMSELRA